MLVNWPISGQLRPKSGQLWPLSFCPIPVQFWPNSVAFGHHLIALGPRLPRFGPNLNLVDSGQMVDMCRTRANLADFGRKSVEFRTHRPMLAEFAPNLAQLARNRQASTAFGAIPATLDPNSATVARFRPESARWLAKQSWPPRPM